MKEWTTQEYDYLFRMLLIGDSGSASFATALTLHRLILSLCDVHSHPNLRYFWSEFEARTVGSLPVHLMH